jgi:hypothetical protein
VSGKGVYEAPDMPGADAVVTWFGYWPTFHDAEVTSIVLDRSGPSRVVVHAFEMTPEVDTQGRYVLSKHAIVTFFMEKFTQVSMVDSNPRIENFNHQNMLADIVVKKEPEGCELVLDAVYGVSGTFRAKRMWVELTPGIPADSMHGQSTKGRPGTRLGPPFPIPDSSR